MSKIIRIAHSDPCAELLAKVKQARAESELNAKYVSDDKVADPVAALTDLANDLSVCLEGVDTTIEGYFTLVAYVLNSTANAELAKLVVQKLGTHRGRGALVALGLLYDSLDFKQLQWFIFNTMLGVAKHSDLIQLMVPHLELFNKTAALWPEFPLQERLNMYWDLINTELPSQLCSTFLLSYLEHTDSLSEERSEFILAKLIDISGPVELIQLLQHPGFQRLAGDSKTLFDSLASGDASKLEAMKSTRVIQNNQSYFDKCAEALRMQGLCRMARENTEFSISHAATQLQIPEADLDEWVFRASSLGLINVTIDQVHDKVYTHNQAAEYSAAGLQALAEKLASLKAKLVN